MLMHVCFKLFTAHSFSFFYSDLEKGNYKGTLKFKITCKKKCPKSIPTSNHIIKQPKCVNLIQSYWLFLIRSIDHTVKSEANHLDIKTIAKLLNSHLEQFVWFIFLGIYTKYSTSIVAFFPCPEFFDRSVPKRTRELS